MKNIKLISLLTAICLCFDLATADNVYRHVDSSGRVTFSTSPQSETDRPEVLPDIKKVNIDGNIERLKESLPPTCDSHGGVDCSKPADSDGSVVCRDGFRGAILHHDKFCKEAKLKSGKITYYAGDRQIVREMIRTEPLTAIKLDLRNLSALEAREVEVELVVSRWRTFRFSGPSAVEGYGFAEYNLNVDDELRSEIRGRLRKISTVVRCQNCSPVLGPMR